MSDARGAKDSEEYRGNAGSVDPAGGPFISPAPHDAGPHSGRTTVGANPDRLPHLSEEPSFVSARDFLKLRSDPRSLIGLMLGDIEIVSLLGYGGFGTVYLGHDNSLDRPVAIKFLHNILQNRNVKLFKREAKAIASLAKYPGIVQIFTWGECHGFPYFVLEYIPGSAQNLLKEHPDGIPISLAVQICTEVAEALQHAHDNDMLHRDIKPANILVDPGDHRIKLADFGLAHVFESEEDSVSEDTGVTGSPPYMSPEQASGHRLTIHSDIYSLGVTLYELLSGKRPLEGNSSAELLRRARQHELISLESRRPELPRSLLKIVEKATRKRPLDRYASAREFAEALRATVSVIGEAQTRSSLRPAAATGTRRRRIYLFFAAAAILLIAGSAAIIFRAGMDGKQVLARANEQQELGDYKNALPLYQQYLARAPEDDNGLYGLAYAQLKMGDYDSARDSFGRISAERLRLEGMAAVAIEQAALEQAGPLLEKKPSDAGPYFDTLQAKMRLMNKQYDEVVALLEGQQGDRFAFRWQHHASLAALAQAYHAIQSPRAEALFQTLAASGDDEYAALGRDYEHLAARREQQEEQRQIREEISQRLNALQAVIADENPPPLTEEAKWTSRPVHFTINEAQGVPGPAAQAQGLKDRIPLWLERNLMQNTGLTPVSRDVLAALLQEQQLSAALASSEGRLRLKQLLSARLQITPQFLSAGGESVYFRIVDNETSQRFQTDEIALDNTDPSTLEAAIFEGVWREIGRAYPIQGILSLNDKGAPGLNIGTSVGVADGMLFRIASAPDRSRVFETGTVRVTSVGPTESTVALEGESFSTETFATSGPFFAVEAAWYTEEPQ